MLDKITTALMLWFTFSPLLAPRLYFREGFGRRVAPLHYVSHGDTIRDHRTHTSYELDAGAAVRRKSSRRLVVVGVFIHSVRWTLTDHGEKRDR